MCEDSTDLTFSRAAVSESVSAQGAQTSHELAPEDQMAAPHQTHDFDQPASADQIERTAQALADNGFVVEVLDDAEAARARIPALIPEGARVFTGASETLRLSGIENDVNTSARYWALKPIGLAMDRATQLDEIRRMFACPDTIIGSVAAVTESGSLVIASATGSQLPGYAGGASQAIWVVGAQKVVPDVNAALERVERHCLPLENERALAVYGYPSAVSRVLILNAEPQPGRGVVLLLRTPIGF